MDTPVAPDDVRIAAERSHVTADAGSRRAAVSSTASSSPLRNVLIVVLESVPAEYVEPYGGAYPVTPTLSRYREHAALFRTIYAHAPSSNKSLISLLGGMYPWVSYQSLTQERPDADLATLSSVLHKRGYRTAFFHSSDLQYQRADAFLRHRHFETVEDYRGRPCDQPLFVTERRDWSYLDGTDDVCTADSVTNWIGASREKPFFGVMWTMMTHYPYFSNTAEAYVDDAFFNRYLNALRRGDEALGYLLRFLEEHDLAASTLVVVVGDHGEAFGRHDQYGHASYIYEENVHVPLLFINPERFNGEAYDQIGGLEPIPELFVGR
jgi:arylsulfatase A-like enzyme